MKNLISTLRYKASYLFLAATILLCFNGCSRKMMPQPEFPLSEEVLTAALKETGLPWDIVQADESSDKEPVSITYSLHIPEMDEGCNNVFINSYCSDEFGRRLQIFFHEQQNKQYWLVEDNASWEDWHEVLVLIAHLYGGFEDAEEIYRVCSTEEMPRDTNVLWEGTLTGGYLRIVTSNPMKPERLKLGNTLMFTLYESEDAYLRYSEIAKRLKTES